MCRYFMFAHSLANRWLHDGVRPSAVSARIRDTGNPWPDAWTDRAHLFGRYLPLNKSNPDPAREPAPPEEE